MSNSALGITRKGFDDCQDRDWKTELIGMGPIRIGADLTEIWEKQWY